MMLTPSLTHTPIALATCLLISMALSACKQDPPADEPIRQVRAMRVAGPEEYMQRNFPGLASASTEVNLSFRVGGPLVARPVNVGDVVDAGDVVARIDPRDFRQPAVQQLRRPGANPGRNDVTLQWLSRDREHRISHTGKFRQLVRPRSADSDADVGTAAIRVGRPVLGAKPRSPAGSDSVRR